MKLSCLYICTDNHNVILNVSDRSVEKLASPDKILESVNVIKKVSLRKSSCMVRQVAPSGYLKNTLVMPWSKIAIYMCILSHFVLL